MTDICKCCGQEIKEPEISEKLKASVDLLHTLVCKLDHDDLCMYYQEEIMTTCWSQAWHRLWLDAHIALATKYPNLWDLLHFTIETRKRLSVFDGSLDWLPAVTIMLSPEPSKLLPESITRKIAELNQLLHDA